MEIEYPVKANICIECGGSITLLQEKGEVVCNECGLIVEEKIVDTGQEGGGQFDKSEKRGRGGAPISMHCRFLEISVLICPCGMQAFNFTPIRSM